MEQMHIFDFLRMPFKITNKIRLIELFGGIGSQAMALRDIGADFEHYRLCEFDKYAVASYNAIHGTDFDATDIRDLKGADLGIEETDKYTYIMTYSFPCQDLSVAGKMRGMTKGSGTRSGLLWEVERLLNETEHLPQVLLMENVPQVHSEDNMPDFQAWIDFLTSKGYVNYWQDLNAKDYGVAQNRDRCFMVSLLGEYNFKFPKTVPLKKVMKDYLEDSVDEKYYITSEKAKMLIDTLILEGKILTPKERRKCIYCDNLLGKKGALGMCNKHYIQYKRWGDPLHADNKERATIDGYYRDGKTGRREHRIIYEEHYGVKLTEDEIIHHINFVKTDNRIENLYKYPNASEHIKAHREFERLMQNLTDNEEIYFSEGKYLKREREREREQTDRLDALTVQSLNRECGTQQTVSKQDTMPEYQTLDQMETWCVNTIGYIEKGTGQHQSNTVYGSDKLSPTITAVNYKEPVKILECLKL